MLRNVIGTDVQSTIGPVGAQAVSLGRFESKSTQSI